MKSRTLLMIAVLAPGLLCPAQNKEPNTAPAATPAPAQPAATPGQPAATPVQTIATVDDSYVIGGNDQLAITVWKEPTLSGTILVRPDGMISMPLIGDIQAAGLTPLHLADQIAAKLKKFIQDPNVSVVVSQIHSKLIYLMGEVGHTGPVDMTPNMTLLEAIGSAGGLTEFANKKKIYILRDEAGSRQKIQVHYKEALEGNRAFDLVLKPGDTIVVP
jgi:polysaccharide biosynthesis/export protein